MRKQPKKRSRVKLFFKVFFLTCFLACIALAIWVLAGIDYSFGDSVESLNLNLSSVVYYTDAETGEVKVFEQLQSNENRIWVDIDEIPEDLQNAFIAIEDQRFRSHHGVDFKRTFGAVINEIFRRQSTYGGSTITQQLVKNLTGDNEVSYIRKAREIIRALILETKLSKEQILELYLNSIYLGQGCNGVESAANWYFDKSVGDLTIAECASIAGITQYPSLYDPFVNPDKNIEKQHVVLEQMLEQGYISQAEYDEALAAELEFKSGEKKDRQNSQSYFADQLVEEVADALVEEQGVSRTIAVQMVYNSGYQIYATVDPVVQEAMESVYEDDDNFPTVRGETQPESAMIVSDPHTGEIKGIVGGRGKKEGSRVLNRATQSLRQPGSSIKPLAVYAPAFDLGVITPATILDDKPITIGDWSPKNYYSGFRGPMTVRRAIELSANIPAIEALQKLTVNDSFDYMVDELHFDTLVEGETRDGTYYTDKTLASLALGGLTDGVTLMEMNAGYAALANGGVYIQPHTFTKVEDSRGKTILKNEPEKNVVFKEETAYITTQMLKSVVDRGTAAGSRITGMDTAGKTGTTDDDIDRWFIGYTPYYVASVWFGFDTPKGLPAFSTNPALAVWEQVMEAIHEPLPNATFERPAGVVSATICTSTGRLASEACSGAGLAITEYFRRGTAPSSYCGGDHGYVPPDENETDAEDGETTGEESSDVQEGQQPSDATGAGGTAGSGTGSGTGAASGSGTATGQTGGSTANPQAPASATPPSGAREPAGGETQTQPVSPATGQSSGE